MPPAAVVREEAPRSGRSRRTGNEKRRGRAVLYAVGGLLGSGWWVSAAVYGGPVLSRIPKTVHLPQFAAATFVVTVACWAILLICGEVLLFALAVVRAGDSEQYDRYRNLMILWGYVLTLGIPRLFRRLPAQFANDDEPPKAEPDEAELRTALDLLLRYAVRYIDDDAAKPAETRDVVRND